MPKVTIWIRESDWQLWQAITDKPDWISTRLNIVETVIRVADNTNQNVSPEFIGPSSEEIFGTKPNSKTCKKGHVYYGDKCLVKGCY